MNNDKKIILKRSYSGYLLGIFLIFSLLLVFQITGIILNITDNIFYMNIYLRLTIIILFLFCWSGINIIIIILYLKKNSEEEKINVLFSAVFFQLYIIPITTILLMYT